jgi:hypothetical protein
MNKISVDGERAGAIMVLGAIVCTAMAAGMGWGIRGQYGHETDAMIAGALTSLVLVLFLDCEKRGRGYFHGRIPVVLCIG